MTAAFDRGAQTAIPIPNPQEEREQPKYCAWCGEPATCKVQIEPERYKMVAGSGGRKERVVARRAIEADACSAHRAMVEREAELTEKRKARDRLRHPKKLLTGSEENRLKKLERELAEAT